MCLLFSLGKNPIKAEVSLETVMLDEKIMARSTCEVKLDSNYEPGVQTRIVFWKSPIVWKIPILPSALSSVSNLERRLLHREARRFNAAASLQGDRWCWSRQMKDAEALRPKIIWHLVQWCCQMDWKPVDWDGVFLNAFGVVTDWCLINVWSKVHSNSCSYLNARSIWWSSCSQIFEFGVSWISVPRTKLVPRGTDKVEDQDRVVTGKIHKIIGRKITVDRASVMGKVDNIIPCVHVCGPTRS